MRPGERQMAQQSIELCPLREADLAQAHALSQAVGWPHRLEDWRLVCGLGEGLMAFAGARPVGTVMWWRYGSEQLRVGMVIVHPDLQGAGLGSRLMDACLSRASEPSILLNATHAGERLYRRLGFSPSATIDQHQGTALASKRGYERVRPLRPADLETAACLDAQAIGAARRPVLDALLATGEAAVLVDGNDVAGVGFCRPFGRGHVIGPLVARDLAGCEQLLAYWIARHTGSFVRVDTPLALGLGRALENCGLAKVDTVTSMVRGEPPERAAFATFALASQALG